VFWGAVDVLEGLVRREVKRRARVTGAAPDESISVSAAGANVELESMGTGPGGESAAAGLLGVRTDSSGIFQNDVNLKRAFLFFDRSATHCITLDDFHATLAELGFVDPPYSGKGSQKEGREEGEKEEKEEEEEEDENSFAALPPPPPPLNPLTTTPSSRLKLQPRVADLAKRAHAAKIRIEAAPFVSYTKKSQADALALMDAWETEVSVPLAPPPRQGSPTLPLSSSTSSGLASTLPFGLPEPPQWDPLAQDLSAGARALVLAVYRRILGESDPGLTNGVIRGWSLAPPEKHPGIGYAHVVAWAAPLAKALKTMREKVQGAFLASATTAGGGKDLSRTFRKVDSNGDGVMSISEFLHAIGPLARMLSPLEIQELTDQFDKDCSGTVRCFCGALFIAANSKTQHTYFLTHKKYRVHPRATTIPQRYRLILRNS